MGGVWIVLIDYIPLYRNKSLCSLLLSPMQRQSPPSQSIPRQLVESLLPAEVAEVADRLGVREFQDIGRGSQRMS